MRPRGVDGSEISFTIYEIGAQMNAGRFQFSSTIYKIDTLGASTMFSSKELFGSIWAPLGVPFWRQLDFERVPKVSFRKSGVQEGVSKTRWCFYWFLMPRWEAWMVTNKFLHYTCCNWRGLGGHEHWWNEGPNSINKFFDEILWGFEKMCFSMSILVGENLAGNRQCQRLWQTK